MNMFPPSPPLPVQPGSRHPFDNALQTVYKTRMRMLRLQLRVKQLKGMGPGVRLPQPVLKPVVTS